MSIAIVNRSKMIADMMRFSFHHRAFYCYIGMSIWICFLITVMYKYISIGEDTTAIKKMIVQNEYISKSDIKYRKIYLKACHPPDSIVRGAEGVVDSDTWLLQGVLVVTRHGDRGPLTHLHGGDKLPCDTPPNSPLLKMYEEYVANTSSAGRAWWVAGPGPFHNFPALPPRAASTSCALGQLTPRGLLQMLTVGSIFFVPGLSEKIVDSFSLIVGGGTTGNILKEAYGEKLGLENVDPMGKRDNGEVLLYSTRYRRTFQSLAGAAWALGGGAGARVARARESHSVHYCFRECACAAHHALGKKISIQSKHRLDNHPALRELVNKLSKVLFESQEHPDAEVVRDGILAHMCHDAPLPCTKRTEKTKLTLHKNHKKLRTEHLTGRNLLEIDIDTLNMELDYINNQLDFNNEIGRKARDIIGKYYDTKDKKVPLDFDAQMEREKLLYYQQRYMDNADAYEDVVIVKKNLDADFNFPNDARMDADFDEDYKEPTPEITENFCVRKEHITSLFAYLEWSYRQEIKNIYNRKRGLLLAYGLIHNIVQNMIRMISENKPKFVLYSGHDKTLQPLILALGLTNHQHYNVQYASRMIFEVYRKRDLRDEFKFTKRKAVAQDFYFHVVYNGEDVTNKLSFCKSKQNVVMTVVDPIDDMKVYHTYLCPIENIVRFIHDDYFAIFNVTNFKDACASFGNIKHL